MSSTSLPRLALLACDVFEHEIALHGGGNGQIVERRYFEMGLHDRPEVLRATLQEAIDEFDRRDGIDAIGLVYGLCGCGTAGLRARRHRLVIPRGHDCITVFLGSKERYRDHQSACPACYYYTPGWRRGGRVPGPDMLAARRAELLERFDEEDVDFLIETERETWAQHDTASFIDLGTGECEQDADYARRCADWLGWRFEHLRGDPALLRDLLHGRWDDERFQIVEPGEELAHSPDERILRAGPPSQP